MSELYAHVEAGQVEQVGRLPSVWRNTDGTWTSNFPEADPEHHAREGWLPFVEERPTFDETTQRLAEDEITVEADRVVRSYTVEDIPPPPPPTAEEVEQQSVTDEFTKIRTKAKAVYAGTDTFTTAQVQKILAALVLRVTR